ncbi:MAG: TolC family protein [Ignavibacteriales bacterium]|nr:MAG: TolC family protein [Ignavibacteriales bacterium]
MNKFPLPDMFSFSAARVLSLIVVFAVTSGAQTLLTLEKSIEIALSQSYAIRSAGLSLQSSKKNLEAIEMGMMTSVNLEFDLPRYSNNLKSQFNSVTGAEQFYEVGNTQLEGRLYFNQPIVFSNGTFSLIGSIFGRDQFSGDNPVTRDYYSNFSLRLRQPLFGFNTLSSNLEKAQINLEKSERNYNRSKSEIVYSVTSAFFNLYQAKKQLEIAAENVNQSSVSYTTAENKFKAGLIAEVEKLQLEVDLASAKNDMLSAENSYSELKDNFKLLIGLPLDEDIEPEGEITYTEILVDEELAVNSALKNRSEIRNSQLDIELSRLSVEETEARGRISGLLVANYGINKNDEKFNAIFRNPAEDRGVTFTLSIPVWDWNQNNLQSEAAQANLELSRLTASNQEQSVRKEITTVLSKIKAAKARVEVLSRSVEVAQKGFDISMERFKSGNITSFDLSQQQLRLTNAKLNSLRALIDYKLTLADLNRKTLYDFGK